MTSAAHPKPRSLARIRHAARPPDVHATSRGRRPRPRAADHRHGRRPVRRRPRRQQRATPAPRLDPGAPAQRPQLPGAEGPDARPVAQHGVRGGPLPQHRGVLGAAHGDRHDPGRYLHPRLRLLRRQDGPAVMERRRRAASSRGGGPPDGSGARRRDQRRPGRPARRWRSHLCRDHPRDAARVARAWASRCSSPTSTARTSRCGR